MSHDRDAPPPPRPPPSDATSAPTPVEGEDEVISLQDLAPRDDVRGGTGKLLFGQDAATRFAADE